MDVANGLVGAGFGLVTAIGGVLKNRQKEKYSFSAQKTLNTIIISGIAGFAIGSSGMPLTEVSLTSATAGFAAVGVTEWINSFCKAALRWYKKN